MVFALCVVEVPLSLVWFGAAASGLVAILFFLRCVVAVAVAKNPCFLGGNRQVLADVAAARKRERTT